MDDQSEASKVERPRRMEILTGGGDRRRWPETLKAQIVAESLAPGVIITELARRHGARASQIHMWRRDAREGRLALPATSQSSELMSFAPVVVSEARPRSRSSRCSAPMIEIEAKGIVVRVREGADTMLVEAMVRALRARG